MSDEERAARERLQRVVETLETVDGELAAIRSGLPVSEREDLMYAGEEDWDFPTEARSVVECARADWIGPAIRNLRETARFGMSGDDAR